MDSEEWQETVAALFDAKRCLSAAWRILDGTDGAASGVEHAVRAALADIDAVYAIEHADTHNADVASPGDVQEFWERHGELPGLPLAPGSAVAITQRVAWRFAKCAEHHPGPGTEWVPEVSTRAGRYGLRGHSIRRCAATLSVWRGLSAMAGPPW